MLPGIREPGVRIIAEYVRKRHVLTLEDAVRKMTSWPATRMGLGDRGVIREGMRADITVFDPATIIDNATFENPQQLSKGVNYVLVNGVAVVDGGRPTGALPGKALRGPGYTHRPFVAKTSTSP